MLFTVRVDYTYVEILAQPFASTLEFATLHIYTSIQQMAYTSNMAAVTIAHTMMSLSPHVYLADTDLQFGILFVKMQANK